MRYLEGRMIMTMIGEIRVCLKALYRISSLVRLFCSPTSYKILSVFLLFCVHTSSAYAQDATSSVEKWKMSYKTVDGYIDLTGEAIRSGGALQLGWKNSKSDAELYERVRSTFPNWKEAKTKNQTDQEIIFETIELHNDTSSGKAISFASGEIVTGESWLKLWADLDLNSNRNALRVLILSLNGFATWEDQKRQNSKHFGIIPAKLAGMKLRLFNPEISDDGRKIVWDWESQIGFDNKVFDIEKVSGSKDNDNPIVWGPASEITNIIVANNQSALDEKGEAPLYPLLTDETKAKIKDTHKLKNAMQRELIVIGRELDDYLGDVVLSGEDVKDSEKLITYSDLKPYEPGFVSGLIKGYHENALSAEMTNRVETLLAEDTDLKAYWVTATVNKLIAPIYIPLEIDDNANRWPLRYGDNTIQISIIKPDKSEFLEAGTAGERLRRPEVQASELFFRDEIVFDASVKTEIKDDTIEIEFAANKVQLGQDFYSDNTAIVTLERDPYDRKHYRSKSFILALARHYRNEYAAKPKTIFSGDADGQGEKITLPADDVYSDLPEEKVLILEEDTWLRPRLAIEHDLRLSAPFADQQVKQANTTVAGDFIEALRIVTSCWGGSEFSGTDWDRLSSEEEKKIAVGFFDKRKISISYGQHAAMLLIKHSFLAQLNKHLDQLNLLSGSKDSVEYRQAIQNAWSKTPSLISTLAQAPVTGIGYRLNLLREQNPNILNNDGNIRADIEELFNELFARQIQHLSSAIQILDSKYDCQIEDLLTTVGRGFDPIATKLKSSVTRLQTNTKTGVKVRRPDVVAIQELNLLPATFAQHERLLVYSDAQWEIMEVALSTFGLVSGLGAAYTGSAALAGAALAFDGVDLTKSCVENVCGYVEDQEKLAIGKSATPFVGRALLNEAQKDAQSAWTRVANVGISGAALGTSAFDFYKHLRKAAPPAGFDDMLRSVMSPSIGADGTDAQTIVDQGVKFFTPKDKKSE